MRYYFLSLCCLVLWGAPQYVGAATFYFTTERDAIGVGDTVDVIVAFDAEGEDVNAIAGALTYDPSFLTLERTNTARSAVNIWVTDPVQNTANDGTVAFAGITPGGFGEVLVPPTDGYPEQSMFVARFMAVREGTTGISIANPESYKNDGLGTALTTTATTLSLRVTPTDTPTTITDEADGIAPDDFTVSVTHDPNLFEDRWFAVFFATDKQSGIQRYEVSENDGPFVTATSPYLLTDQDGATSIRVRAYDVAGNVTESYRQARRTHGVQILIGCILAVIIGSLLIFAARRK